MNPSVLGAAAASLLVLLWLLGRRRPRPFLRSDDTSAVAALNRAQITKLAPDPAARSDDPGAFPIPLASARMSPPAAGFAGPAARLAEPGPLASVPPPAPADRRGRRLLLAQLTSAALGPLDDRLAAVRLARRWRHPATLPLLRRALRDVHPAVVHEAALALEAYRGRTAPSAPAASRSSSPRKVARTR
ncbi:MAG: hypothetical protein ACK55X_11365 [Synechococcaceae cyanobacterium]